LNHQTYDSFIPFILQFKQSGTFGITGSFGRSYRHTRLELLAFLTFVKKVGFWRLSWLLKWKSMQHTWFLQKRVEP